MTELEEVGKTRRRVFTVQRLVGPRHERFVEIETDKFLAMLDEATKPCFGIKAHERALYLLLNEFADSLPDLGDAYYFHKAFRQTDVTATGGFDMAIWQLMQSCQIVWDVLKVFERPNANLTGATEPEADK